MTSSYRALGRSTAVATSLALVFVACGGSTFDAVDSGALTDSSTHADTGTHDSSTAPDATHLDAVAKTDAPAANDAGLVTPEASTPETGTGTPDVGTPDASAPIDTGSPFDAPAPHDASTVFDAPFADAPTEDAATPHDASTHHDGSPHDGSTPHDASGPVDATPDVPVAPGCPATVPSGDCTMNLQQCVYPTAACVCSSGAPPTATIHWNCSTLATGCPDPEPALGTSCSHANLVCDYGACQGGDQIICKSGKWKADPSICPG